jgi:hypothetical protein
MNQLAIKNLIMREEREKKKKKKKEDPGVTSKLQ